MADRSGRRTYREIEACQAVKERVIQWRRERGRASGVRRRLNVEQRQKLPPVERDATITSRDMRREYERRLGLDG